MDELQQQQREIAFVSGGTKGIGLAIVKALVKAGYAVVTCGRDREAWQRCLDDEAALATAVDFQQCDLSDDVALHRLFSYIGETYGRLAIAVNNASTASSATGPFDQVAVPALMATLVSDLWVPTLCMQHELHLMQGHGAIVNITSINGLRPIPGAAMYGAAKHGLEGLTRSVALEAIERGIRVNAVAPGATWTPRWENRVNEGKANRQAVEELIPLKRFATPNEIAAAVLWLASDAASYIVGHTLVIDGGLSLQ